MVALLALPSAAAGDGPQPGVAAAQSGPKDYSRNSATATSPARGTPRPPGTCGRRAWPAHRRRPAPDRPRQVSVDNPWPEIAAGFVAGFLVAGGAAIVAGRTRRTRVAT